MFQLNTICHCLTIWVPMNSHPLMSNTILSAWSKPQGIQATIDPNHNESKPIAKSIYRLVGLPSSSSLSIYLAVNQRKHFMFVLWGFATQRSCPLSQNFTLSSKITFSFGVGASGRCRKHFKKSRNRILLVSGKPTGLPRSPGIYVRQVNAASGLVWNK